MKKILIILLAIAGSFGRATSQQPSVVMTDKPGWHKIATRTVDLKTDRDQIDVIGADRFAAIKFKVLHSAIDLQDLLVTYEDGTKEDVMVRTPIKMGGESRVIDLKGTERDIKSIAFVYKTLPNTQEQKAQVEVWGLKTNADKTAETAKNDADAIAKPGIVVSDKAGWHKIAETTVAFEKDRDEVAVVGADRFAGIKFKVTDASINLMDLEVYFENGTKQDVSVASVIKSGNESRVIDLNSGERDIKKIVFVYKTVPNQREEKAHVEIWGLKTNTN
ncbi:MAG: hypothetical protein ACHQNT_08965 [Bacteroidia bacterium]